MGIADYIFSLLFLLCAVLFIVKIRHIRKAEQKVIISKLNKKNIVLLGILILLYIAFVILLFRIFGFDTDTLRDMLYQLIYVLLLFGNSFICITPDGTVGENLKNNGLIPKEDYRYRYTFKGIFQIECLELYTKNDKRPITYYGNIKNPELIRILEENYEQYREEDL